FQADHFRALCRFGTAGTDEADFPIPGPREDEDTALVPLNPAADLYGDLLFQAGRFRRLQGYRRLRAKACPAEMTPAAPRAWMAPLLGPYVVRRLAELIPGAEVDIVVELSLPGEPRADSTAALRLLLGTPLPIHRRPDGKPEVAAAGAVAVSAAHAGALL